MTEIEPSYYLLQSQKVLPKSRSEESPYDVQQFGDLVASYYEELDELTLTDCSSLEREPNLQASPLQTMQVKRGPTISASRKRKCGSNDRVCSHFKEVMDLF